MTVGDRIKKIRESLGMTQEDLALACGWQSRSTINKIEKGVTETRLSNIKKVAAALSVDPDFLVFGDDSEMDSDAQARVLMEYYRSMSDVDRARLVGYAAGLAEKGGKS